MLGAKICLTWFISMQIPIFYPFMVIYAKKVTKTFFKSDNSPYQYLKHCPRKVSSIFNSKKNTGFKSNCPWQMTWWLHPRIIKYWKLKKKFISNLKIFNCINLMLGRVHQLIHSHFGFDGKLLLSWSIAYSSSSIRNGMISIPSIRVHVPCTFTKRLKK